MKILSRKHGASTRATRMIAVFLMSAASSLISGVTFADPKKTYAEPSEMHFSLEGTGGNCNVCEWLSASGRITSSSADNFENFLRSELPNSDGEQTILFDSPGGDLIGGLRLGESIRRHKFSTKIGRSVLTGTDSIVIEGKVRPLKYYSIQSGDCASACAYAFLGGVEREAKSGELGFHQFYQIKSVANAITESTANSSMATAQRLMGLLVIYLKEMDVDESLLSFASVASPTQLFMPDDDSLFSLRIVNKSVHPFLKGWKVLPVGKGAIVSSEVFGGPNADGRLDESVALFCRSESQNEIYTNLSWHYPAASSREATQDNKFLHTAVEKTSLVMGGHVMREGRGYDGIFSAQVDDSDFYHLTFSMTVSEFVEALKTGGFEYEVEGPHALGYFGFDFFIPTSGLADFARITFNSCI